MQCILQDELFLAFQQYILQDGQKLRWLLAPAQQLLARGVWQGYLKVPGPVSSGSRGMAELDWYAHAQGPLVAAGL